MRRMLIAGALAAIRLPGTGLSASTPIGIWGYSEGGLASTWATELQPSYAPELNVKGTAAGGVPAKHLPRVPMKIYESVNDELIPVAGVRELVASYCAQGVTVHYREDLLSEHISLAATGAPEAVAWLADRFAGRPAPSTC